MITQDKFDKIEEILKEYIGKVGTFVEIGAYDGDTYSHTAHLADAGWKGYYFEPVLEYAIQCKNRHQKNKVDVIPVAIGEPGIKRFYVSELLSTFHGKQYQDKVTNIEWFRDSKNKFRSRKVAVCHPQIIPECDFMVIDVEGSEHFILDKLKIKPKVLMVELHEKSKDWQAILDTRPTIKLLESKGYTKVYSDDTDSIFIYAI